MRVKINLFFLIILLLSIKLNSQSINISGHKQNIVVIGRMDSITRVPVFVGTGFIVQIDGIFHLVTAKHVVTKSNQDNGLLSNNFDDKDLYGFYYDKKGNIKANKISDVKKNYSVDWLYHDDINVDIALIPFDIDINNDSLKVVPDKDFVSTNKIFETYDVYFISYHPNLTDLNDFQPIFRKGSVARKNKDKTILLDAFAFPGNSGSPAFLAPSPIRFDSNNYNIGGDELAGKLIGIIGSYIPYQDVAISVQTKKPRIIFEENAGIALIWTVDYLKEIIANKRTQYQINYIKEKILKK